MKMRIRARVMNNRGVTQSLAADSTIPEAGEIGTPVKKKGAKYFTVLRN
jgi:hypothetical protein